MLTASVDVESLNRAIVSCQATEAQARKALNSTMVKMAAWVRTRTLRGLSAKLKIQQQILRRRVRTFRMGGALSHAQGDGSVKVWFGLNPIPWGDLKPRPMGNAGVIAAGGRRDEHAFILDQSTKGGRNVRRVMKREGKGRLPLIELKALIGDEATEYLNHYITASAEFGDQFMRTFERELKWRTSTRA